MYFRRKKLTLFLLSVIILTTLTVKSFAGNFKQIDTSKLRYESNGQVYTIDISKAPIEEENGTVKFCLCQGVAFRISQLMSSCWPDGVFHTEDITIETGWNTDGPYELWEDDLGVNAKNIIIAKEATDGKNLTKKDSWYKITVKSTGKSYIYKGENLYPDKFLELRSKLKNGTITAEEKKEQQALRKKIVTKLKTTPFSGIKSLKGTKKHVKINEIITSDTLSYSSKNKGTALEIMDSVTEKEGEKTKICLCQAVAFRISQMISPCWPDKKFHPEDVTIETRWNTDGPYEFWQDDLGIAKKNIVIAKEATANENLTLSDCWYKVTMRSTGETFCFKGTDDLYKKNFLELRSKFKNKTITESEKKEMAVLRKAIEADITKKPVVGLIEATEPDESSSGCNTGLPSLSSLLVLSPFLFIKKH